MKRPLVLFRRAQLRRIARYEELLRELRRLLSGPDLGPGALDKARPLAAQLEAYYTSRAWKRDFAADEAGLLPRELPRGVLSEDGIDDALTLYRERLDGEEGLSD